MPSVPVHLRFHVKRSILYSQVNGAKAWPELHFDCKPSTLSGVLEIGDHYAFSAKHKRTFFCERKACRMHVTLKPKSMLTDEQIRKIGLSDSKLKFMTFTPTEKDNLLEGLLPASLDATIFVSDLLIERLISILSARNKIHSMSMDIEKEDVLTYGWEPDGSRKVWKLTNPEQGSEVDVTSIEFSIRL